MKFVTTLLTLAFAVNASQASAKGFTESIASLAAQLGEVMSADEIVTVLRKGKTARELIEQKYLEDNKIKEVDEDFNYEELVTSIQESDGSTRGTATLDAAKAFTSWSISEYAGTDEEGNSLDKEEMAIKDQNAMDLLERLDAAGAIFGFDSYGSGVCGMNFTTLSVIDVIKKTIHEFIVIKGPC